MSSPAQYNLRLLRPLAESLRANHGEEAVKKLAAAGGVRPADFDGNTQWVPIDSFETMIAAARVLFPDDASFKKASVYGLAEAYGPVRYVLWATTPDTIYSLAGKTYRLVTTNGHVQILSRRRTSQSARLVRDVPISRLHCILQQAQTAALPTLWGLPPAHLREESCVAFGDDACVWHLRWLDAKRFMPMVLGAAVLGALAFVLFRRGPLNVAGPSAFALLGFVLGYLYELRRTAHANQEVNKAINDALEKVAEDDAEARRENLALHERQREWSRMLEEETIERTKAFQAVVDRVREMQHTREGTLRGFSHDLKTPLAVLRINTEYLREAKLGPEVDDVANEFDQMIGQMQKLLDDLVSVVTSQTMLMQITPMKIESATMTERLGRRLRALVHGRDIRSNVLRSGGAPDSIRTDPMVFDRVLDNILTNAAKYTERGSIVVELDGSPDSLVIKVADTGRGIAAEDLQKTFEPGGSDPNLRARFSHGVGLSVAVQLLGQVGGKLVVMSKPSHGTTFWIHFPLDVPDSEPVPVGKDHREHHRAVVDRVVTIKPSNDSVGSSRT